MFVQSRFDPARFDSPRPRRLVVNGPSSRGRGADDLGDDDAPSRLVLFVGAALRPEGALATELARDGVRCLWRASTEQAVRTAQLATFDAVCMDITTLGAGSAGIIHRLRESLACPLLIVGGGADPREELDALDQGADLYLARPLPARRLAAHLLALLRRGQPAAARPRPSAPAAPAAPGLAQLPLPAGADSGAALLERLFSAVGRGHAIAEVEGDLTVRASQGAEGVEVTIRGLQLRLR
ncbi:MAG: hypothetical protein JNN18_14560 [Rubrivivax sp.]|nr:hypothetical protein [Rubrivivax sp.]